MSKTNFTPGKWEVEKLLSDRDDEYIVISIGDSGGCALLERHIAGKDQHDMPNANLIASAPTLYGALQVALITIDHAAHQAGSRGGCSIETEYLKCADIIVKALKKARGQENELR